MSDDVSDEKILELKRALDKILDDRRSIKAPCNNAYKDSRDGNEQCSCWRCRPERS